MSRAVRTSLLVLLIACCTVVGFVVGWSNAGSGGLEVTYRAATVGAACGLSIGAVTALIVALHSVARTEGSQRRWVVGLGVTMCGLGLIVAVRATLLMYDTSTTTYVWMIHQFGGGVCLVCWGLVAVTPRRWRRAGVVLATLASAGLVVAVLLVSQGVPS